MNDHLDFDSYYCSMWHDKELMILKYIYQILLTCTNPYNGIEIRSLDAEFTDFNKISERLNLQISTSIEDAKLNTNFFNHLRLDPIRNYLLEFMSIQHRSTEAVELFKKKFPLRDYDTFSERRYEGFNAIRFIEGYIFEGKSTYIKHYYSGGKFGDRFLTLTELDDIWRAKRQDGSQILGQNNNNSFFFILYFYAVMYTIMNSDHEKTNLILDRSPFSYYVFHQAKDQLKFPNGLPLPAMFFNFLVMLVKPNDHLSTVLDGVKDSNKSTYYVRNVYIDLIMRNNIPSFDDFSNCKQDRAYEMKRYKDFSFSRYHFGFYYRSLIEYMSSICKVNGRLREIVQTKLAVKNLEKITDKFVETGLNLNVYDDADE